MMDLATLVRYSYRRSPFYRRQFASLDRVVVSDATHIPPFRLPDVAAPTAGDPLQGRQTHQPVVIYQLEYEVPVFQGFSHDDLKAYAGVLSDAWHQAGVRAGDRVAIYDYGSSPITYLSSRAICPHLQQGAADRMGAVVICNDGLPELVERWWHLLTYFQPQILFIRCDSMGPFVGLLTRWGGWPAPPPRQVVVSGNEEWPAAREIDGWERALGVAVRRLVRADLAMWLALECPAGRVHVDSERYLIEVVDAQSQMGLPAGEEGVLTITCLFARTAPSIRYISTISGRLCLEACPCGEADPSITLE